MKNLDLQLKESLKCQISEKIPSYIQLNDEDQEIVDKYISSIDLNNLETIGEIGKYEIKKLYRKLDILKMTLEICNIKIEDIFNEVKSFVNENSKPKKKSLFNSLKERLINKDKEKSYLINIESIIEKLEYMRIELKLNAGKLNIIAKDLQQQYINTQYQIISLQVILKTLQQEKMKEKQTKQDSSLNIAETVIRQRIDYCVGINVNAQSSWEMSKLLAQNSERLARHYEQYLIQILPKVKEVSTMTEVLDSQNEFINKMNEILTVQTKQYKQAIKRVQNICSSNGTNIEPIKVLRNDVSDIVTSLKEIQDEGKQNSESYTQLLEDSKNRLIKQFNHSNGIEK